MILYYFKMVACSGLLFSFYYFFLSKEKMLRFNRLYLLVSVIFSFIAPLITFHFYDYTDNSSVQLIQTFNSETYFHTIPNDLKRGSLNKDFNISFILISLYIIVSFVFLFRFIKNLTALYSIIQHNKHADHDTAKLVLLDKNPAAYSFLHFIFIDKEEYEKNLIDKKIITHECTHVKQRHTADLLFIEVLLIIAWCNPFLYLYKKAIQINHEFLADEAVLYAEPDIAQYQTLLLQKSVYANKLSISSQLNFSITKNRFIMMTKNTPSGLRAAKQITVLFLLALTAIIFSNKVFAQADGKNSPKQQKLANGAGAPQELLNEYDATIQKMRRFQILKSGKKVEVIDMSKGDVDRLAYIYRLMSKEQRDERIKNTGITIDSVTAPKRNSPTTAQLEKWTDPKTYGVWINEKRIANSKLDNYKPSDFAFYFPSKLTKVAVQNDHFLYQIDLMTPAYYSKVWETGPHYMLSKYHTAE